MAETDNPDVTNVAPRAARFGEGPEGKAARRERGQSGQPSGPSRMIQFLHDVRAEMKRVSWPTSERSEEHDHHHFDRRHFLRGLLVSGRSGFVAIDCRP